MITLDRRAALALVTAAGASIAAPALASPSINNTRLIDSYLDAWRRKDLDGILACVHEDLVFKAPTGAMRGKDAYRASTRQFLSLVLETKTRADVRGDGQAMFVHDFLCRSPVGLAPTAELVTIQNDLIRESEIFFDVRPFEALARTQRAQQP